MKIYAHFKYALKKQKFKRAVVRAKMKMHHKLKLQIRRQYQSQVERKYYGVCLQYRHHYNVDNRLLCRVRNCLNFITCARE